ncbi:MAG: hypothetical protein LIO92_11620 [Clostridiales bacterium]|nr:hypothetical protein [Clostridiales bacterium]
MAGKRVLHAFTVGAAGGIIGQIILSLVSAVVPDAVQATLISMLLFGIVGAMFILSGIYGKVAQFGEEGAGLVLSGLMFGATVNCVEKIRSGEPNGRAALIGFSKVFMILGTGFIISLVFGLITG